MKNWQTKKLWEVCDKTSNIKWSEVKDRDFKYIDLSAVSRNNLEVNSFVLVDSTSAPSRAKKIVQSGDIIFATTRPTLKRIAKITDEFNDQICSTGFVVLRAQKDCIISDIIFYFLQTDSFMESMKNLQRGASYPAVSDGDVKDQVLGIPKSLDEQKRIVKILDGVFGDILIARENAEKNLANAKELFESYLEDVFTNEKRRKKNEKWEEKKLGDVCEIKPPKKEAKEEVGENDLVSFLPMRDLGVAQRTVSAVQERKLKDVSGSYTYFANDDVLLAKITPCFENGKLGIATNLKNGIGFGSSEYIIFRSNTKGRILSEYLFYNLSRSSFRKLGKERMGGAVGHKRVSKEFIEEFIVYFPISLKEQKQIVEKLDALSADTKKLEKIYQQKIDDLDELKKAVLKSAFAGEL